MNVRTLVRIVASTAIAASAAAHSATNPLEPGYYQGKPAHVVAADAQAARYVDNSPLAPTFYEGKPAARFEATAARDSGPYVDRHNPLDPSYRAK